MFRKLTRQCCNYKKMKKNTKNRQSQFRKSSCYETGACDGTDFSFIGWRVSKRDDDEQQPPPCVRVSGWFGFLAGVGNDV